MQYLPLLLALLAALSVSVRLAAQPDDEDIPEGRKEMVATRISAGLVDPDILFTRQGAEYTVLDRHRNKGFTFYQSDYNSSSFRSNLVLRWEWLRGSTLYVVWQQNHAKSNTHGEPVRLSNLLDGIASSGDTFLALKVSYWLSVY